MTTVALAPGRENVVGGEVRLVKLVPGRVPLRELGTPALKASLVPNVALPRHPASLGAAVRLLDEYVRRGALPETLLVHVEWASQVERALELLSDYEGRIAFVEGAAASPEIGVRLDALWAEDSSASGESGPSKRIVWIPRPAALDDPAEPLVGVARLAHRGVSVALASAGTRRDALTTALLAVEHGLDPDAAFRALTSTPAETYGVGEQIGSIAAGRDADIVIWTDDPFSLRGRVERVFIDGEEVFRAYPSAAGSPAASESEPSALPAESRRVELIAADSSRATPSARASSDGASSGEPSSDGAPGDGASGDGASGDGASGDGASGDGASGDGASSDGASGDGAESRAWFVSADRVYLGGGEVLEGGRILVEDGRIAAVGAELEAPDGARVLSVAGSVVPGFIDGGSSLGIRGPQADEFSELDPSYRVTDALEFRSREARRAFASGVTTAVASPGGRNIIGGLGAVFKTARPGTRAVISDDSFVALSLCHEAHLGNRTLRFGTPTHYFYRLPTTRMGTVFLARRAFSEALDIAPQGVDFLADETSSVKLMLDDAARDRLRRIASGQQALRVRAHTRAEILAAIRLAGEFDLSIQIEGAREAFRVIDRLSPRVVGVFLDADPQWTDLRANPEVSAEVPQALARAEVPFGFYSESASAVASLRERAIWCVRFGLDEAAALRALTVSPAVLLGVQKRVGSIAVGLDADLVAVGGQPFDGTAPVQWILSEGQLVSPAGTPIDGAPSVQRTQRSASAVDL